MYSTYNEEKSVIAKRFIGTLKSKIYKHMKAASKNVYFDVLNDIVDKLNNTYYRTIRMKPIDVKSDYFAGCSVECNEKCPKFKVGDHVRISKCRTNFAKGYAPNLSGEVWSEKLKRKFHELISLVI